MHRGLLKRTTMRASLTSFAVLGLTICTSSQSFHRAYGDWGPYPWMSFAASTDAYYLAHVGSFDGFEGLELIKVDLAGDTVWALGMEGSNSRLACGPDGVFLDRDGSLSKFDPSGELLWTNWTRFGSFSYCSRIHPLEDGVLAVGERDYWEQVGDIRYAITLRRYDVEGSLLWGKSIALPFTEPYASLNALASVIAPNGDIVLAGDRLDDSGYPHKPMLARFTPDGDLVWMRTYTDPSNVSPLFVPTDLIATSDGNFALAGSDFVDGPMGHLLKFDDVGDILWARRFHAQDWTMVPRSLIEDGEQRLVMAGGCYTFDSWDGFLSARWDLDGALVDALAIGDIGFTYPATMPYQASGQDLIERVGQGYVISGASLGRGALMTLGFNGVPGCPELGSTFPLVSDTATWDDLPFGDLPTTFSDATDTLVDIPLIVIPQHMQDVCLHVGTTTPRATEEAEFRAWPVPATDQIFCSWPERRASTVTLELLDPAGRVVLRKTVNGPQPCALAVGHFTRGIYSLRMISDTGTATCRVFLR